MPLRRCQGMRLLVGMLASGLLLLALATAAPSAAASPASEMCQIPVVHCQGNCGDNGGDVDTDCEWGGRGHCNVWIRHPVGESCIG
ncbi:MAG: hypothetical protein QOI63_346 [Thermoplasmata archaeon]|nr:hypothetical protein [Thermoplasmata archaeon]